MSLLLLMNMVALLSALSLIRQHRGEKSGKVLDATSETTVFNSPSSSDRKVFLLADPPLLIKLIRNCMLDHGLRLSVVGLLDGILKDEVLSRELLPKLETSHLVAHGND